MRGTSLADGGSFSKIFATSFPNQEIQNVPVKFAETSLADYTHGKAASSARRKFS